MNSQNQTPESNLPAASSGPILQNSSTAPLPSTDPIPTILKRRRNGKVPKLPKPIRDRINQMLDDGLPYPGILNDLGAEAAGLTNRAIMSWKQVGYQEYLRQQQLLDECRARTERAFTMLRDQNPLGAFRATQQIATAQICEAVADMGGDTLRQALAANPLNYFRMLNSFARLTNGGLKCERHPQDDTERRATRAESKNPSPKGGMSEKRIREIEDTLQML